MSASVESCLTSQMPEWRWHGSDVNYDPEPMLLRIRSERVATYSLTIVNEHFSQEGEQESPDVVTAWQDAIASAITIAADQVSHGNPFFGAEVTLEQGNKRIGRYVVSVGATPLKD